MAKNPIKIPRERIFLEELSLPEILFGKQNPQIKYEPQPKKCKK